MAKLSNQYALIVFVGVEVSKATQDSASVLLYP